MIILWQKLLSLLKVRSDSSEKFIWLTSHIIPEIRNKTEINSANAGGNFEDYTNLPQKYTNNKTWPLNLPLLKASNTHWKWRNYVIEYSRDSSQFQLVFHKTMIIKSMNKSNILPSGNTDAILNAGYRREKLTEGVCQVKFGTHPFSCSTSRAFSVRWRLVPW